MQKSATALILVFIIAILGIGSFFIFGDSKSPTVVLNPQSNQISPTRTLSLKVTDDKNAVKNISIVAKNKDQSTPILTQTFTDKLLEREVSFDLKALGLKDAQITLEITVGDASFAKFGKGNSQTYSFPIHIDGTPPRIAIKTSPPNIRRGGSAVILYSLSKEVEKTGVKVGDLFFPAFPQGDKGYLCFFAYPYSMTNQDFNPVLVATDLAGNEQSVTLPANKMHQEFKHDTIAISQNLLDTKDAEFSQMVPEEMSKIDRFLTINSKMRKSNTNTLLHIGQDTVGEILWQGKFSQLPRGATRAGFADHRTYTWQGTNVDEQTHLGYDFASTTNAPVPAANSGRVVFADYLGIYGNLVILDHGLGVQSLYSHLSQINVQVGQNIQKDEIIGNTGNSGMAVGDHLHFGMLVSGLEVSPLEWLDAKWIDHNITTRLNEAGFSLVAP